MIIPSMADISQLLFSLFQDLENLVLQEHQ